MLIQRGKAAAENKVLADTGEEEQRDRVISHHVS